MQTKTVEHQTAALVSIGKFRVRAASLVIITLKTVLLVTQLLQFALRVNTTTFLMQPTNNADQVYATSLVITTLINAIIVASQTTVANCVPHP